MDSLTVLLEEGLAQGAFPAAQACVVCRGQVVHASAHGADHQGRETTDQSLFDIASVTKVAATTVSLAVLVARRTLRLEDPASRFLPQLARGPYSQVTIREILAHRGGWPAWEPLFQAAWNDPACSPIFQPRCQAAPEAFARARQVTLTALWETEKGGPRGTRVYSDLGFMVLGCLIEQAAGTTLDDFCHREVFGPLALTRTGFGNLILGEGAPFDPLQWQVLPTGLTRPREPAPGQSYPVPPQPRVAEAGVVDDDNAYVLGGVAGHAGLFSTAEDLARFGWLIFEEQQGANRLHAGDALIEFSRPDQSARGPLRGLGFDLPAARDSLVGSRWGRSGPRGAIGHWGFTGCSLWIDLDQQVVAALLTNRTFPSRAQVEGLRAFRPRFHEAVMELVSKDEERQPR